MTRKLRRPPGWLLIALGVIAAAGLCWSASSQGTAFLIGLGAACLAVLVLVCWLFRTIACAVTAKRLYLRMLAVPLIVAATVLVLQLDVPTRLRFAQARPAFEHAATAIEAGADAKQFEGRLGTYRVERIAVRDEGGVYFVLNGFFNGEHGFAYLPDGPPPPAKWETEDRRSETLIAAPWYSFYIAPTYD